MQLIKPRPSQSNPLFRRVDSKIHADRANAYYKYLSPYIKEGTSVIDIGAGDGMLCALMAKKLGCYVRGYDVDYVPLVNSHVEVYDGYHLPLEDKSVDTSICVATLHHCDNQRQVLKEIRRVTRRRFLLVEDTYNTVLQRLMVKGFHHYLRLMESMPFNSNGFRSSKWWEGELAFCGFTVKAVHSLGRVTPYIPILNDLYICG